MKILFVCLGNICRSPTAEGVVRRIARDEFPELALTLDSAGTGDYHIGAAPDRRATAHATQRGYDIGSLRARQVRPEDFTAFDLIVAMDDENRRGLEAVKPANATARIAMFLDFAPGRAGEPVPDPYYGGEADFEQVLDLSEVAARGLLATLRRGLMVSGDGDDVSGIREGLRDVLADGLGDGLRQGR